MRIQDLQLLFACCTRRAMASPAAVAEAPAPTSAPVLPYRVGHGFDLHRLAEGYKLIIGGVEIPHTKGCEAHSDGELALLSFLSARSIWLWYMRGRTVLGDVLHIFTSSSLFTAGDVLLHTVTDAILGALCLPDIGKHAANNQVASSSAIVKAPIQRVVAPNRLRD